MQIRSVTNISLPPLTTNAGPVLVVEDDASVQQRLRAVLVGLGYSPDSGLLFADSLRLARQRLAHHTLGLALVDLGLPDGNGTELIAELRAAHPDLPIMVISSFSDEATIFAALRVGASGYVLKERDDVEVALAIRSALRGGAPIDPFIARRILQQLPPPSAGNDQALKTDATPLTPRESEILRLVAQGLSNRAIAAQLGIAVTTVESHAKRIYQKLAVESRTQAIRVARKNGMIV
ncbi:response regulator transcription factor [Ottowia testudinis]|uniref:Response regulator transcription factor n=1 Tax=Ottowia testudinis TaxID=2816950 RepID=A0A975CCP9_9BURK|nr:response regulator transcription factor [Ottowia testudinis]QTD43970.1 response regulator transcription factor [Ottowia testudinis]